MSAALGAGCGKSAVLTGSLWAAYLWWPACCSIFGCQNPYRFSQEQEMKNWFQLRSSVMYFIQASGGLSALMLAVI